MIKPGPSISKVRNAIRIIRIPIIFNNYFFKIEILKNSIKNRIKKIKIQKS